jgi:ribose transport system permease protein
MSAQSDSPRPAHSGLAAWKARLAFGRIGAVYVLVLLVVVFGIWIPGLFLTVATLRQILNSYAVTAIAALSLVVPLSAGVFDVSGAYTISLTGVLGAYLIVHGVPLVLAISLSLLAALVVGLANGLVVVGLRIDSLIGTLAMGSLIEAADTLISGDVPITSIKLAGPFANIAQSEIFGITLPVLYAVVVAGGIWYLFEYTATGRRLYATGFNRTAAQLAGVRTEQLRFSSLLVSSFFAGVAGIVLASTIGAGDSSVGPPYLLTSFAAVFLGATQFKQGRFNALGTILAVLLLGTGITGLGLVNAPTWASSMFTGVVLIAALAVTGAQRRKVRSGRIPDDEFVASVERELDS